MQGRSTGRHACTHIPQRAPLLPSKERRVRQGSAGLALLPYKVLPYLRHCRQVNVCSWVLQLLGQWDRASEAAEVML